MSTELTMIIITGMIGAIIAMIKFAPSRGSNKGNSTSGNPTSNVQIHKRCTEHSGLIANADNLQGNITELKNGQGKIWTAVTGTQKAITETHGKMAKMELNLIKEIKSRNNK